MQHSHTNIFPHKDGEAVVEGLHFSFYYLLGDERGKFQMDNSRYKRICVMKDTNTASSFICNSRSDITVNTPVK